MPIIQHGYSPRRRRGGSYLHKLIRAEVLAGATHCVYCQGTATPDDPFEAAHLVAVARGGQDTLDNYAAAHRSCNLRWGAGGLPPSD
jgi:5-methylcytosine-specific restriction endonuclease McrA